MSKHYITATCYNRKGHILSVGRNSYTKTHPLQAYFAKKVNQDDKIYLHAEIDALLKSNGKIVDSITVIRSNRQGQPRMSKPCAICAEALKAHGVKTVRYYDSNGVDCIVSVVEL